MTFPLAQLYQFLHCSLLYSGVNTQWQYRTPEEEEEHQRIVNRLKAKRKHNEHDRDP